VIIINDTGGYVRDAKELAILQSYPLWLKVKMSQERIRDWVYHYGENGVVVSFSGGKDSTALLHLVRQEFPDIKAVFSNTGLEFPEIQRFVKSFDNVDIVTPKMRFDEVISTYGYPLISKEVAEAIYYARRIRSQDVNVERERERESRTSIEQYKRTELFGERTTRYSKQDGSSWGNERSTHTHGGNVGDRPQTGQLMRQTTFKRLEIQGGESDTYPDKHSEKQKDGLTRTVVRTSRGSTDWANWRRGCL